jgi:hypothetical protein
MRARRRRIGESMIRTVFGCLTDWRSAAGHHNNRGGERSEQPLPNSSPNSSNAVLATEAQDTSRRNAFNRGLDRVEVWNQHIEVGAADLKNHDADCMRNGIS